MTERPADAVEHPLLDVFDRKTLDILVTHILESGSLGRSKIYAQLFQYLIKSAGQTSSPKEIEIAMEVLGRNVDFDVSKDSVVRVYIHQLRKKLDNYYRDHYPLKFGRQPGYRIIIPKGEYTITAIPFQPETQDEHTDRPLPNQLPLQNLPLKSRPPRPWLIAAVFLLLANLVFLFGREFFLEFESPIKKIAEHPIWQDVLSDDNPIILVVGDYYIFGELDDAGNVKRMVREFSINSKMDLEELFMTEPELAWKYNDLDLSYIPEGSAFAINSVSAILPYGKKNIEVKMMSELTTEDITTHHIIYVGYISGLDRLHNMVFAASGLAVGSNYDELINKSNQDIYTSTAGLPSFSEPFTDYGLLSIFPSANNKKIMVVAGMRDAGLIQTAQGLSDLKQLQLIEDTVKSSPKNNANGLNAFEMLFEVQGLNRKNFNAKIVYTHQIDYQKIWNDDLTGIEL